MENENQVTEPQKSEEIKTFTQEDVNNLVSRETKSAIEKLLKDLGVEDVKSAKEGLKTFKEMQEAQKTDLQRATERAEALEREVNQYKEKEKYSNEIENVKNILASKDIDTKYASTIRKLIGNTEIINEALIMQTVQEELPMLLETEQIKVGVEKKDAKPTSSIDDYLEKKYGKNPFFKK